MTITRRTVVRGAAWTVPLVAVAVNAPAFAASIPVPHIEGNSTGGKCPGHSTDFTKGFVIPISLTGDASLLTVTNLTYNGQLLTPADFCVAQAGPRLFSVAFDSTSSANGTGGGSFHYVITYGPGGTLTTEGDATFSYNGTHPIDNSVRDAVCAAAGNCV